MEALVQYAPLERETGLRPQSGKTRIEFTKADSWSQPVVARLGELVDPTDLTGFIALLDGQPAGLASCAVPGQECELVTIRSLLERHGDRRLPAVTEARGHLKPSIPQLGAHGIPIAHEPELEFRLQPRRSSDRSM